MQCCELLCVPPKGVSTVSRGLLAAGNGYTDGAHTLLHRGPAHLGQCRCGACAASPVLVAPHQFLLRKHTQDNFAFTQ